MLRELHVLEGARSLTEQRGARAEASPPGDRPLPPAIDPRNVLDGRYGTLWAGNPGRSEWSLIIHLPEPRTIDRIALTLGLDAVTVPRRETPGRSFAVAAMPLSYMISASPDADPGHARPIDEASPRRDRSPPGPKTARRARRAAPFIQTLIMTIDDAAQSFGGRDPATRAPVVRDIGLFDAHDDRPAVLPPAFWSVAPTPRWSPRTSSGVKPEPTRNSPATRITDWSGSSSDCEPIPGWPADASRRRDPGRGAFVEAIEGDALSGITRSSPRNPLRRSSCSPARSIGISTSAPPPATTRGGRRGRQSRVVAGGGVTGGNPN